MAAAFAAAATAQAHLRARKKCPPLKGTTTSGKKSPQEGSLSRTSPQRKAQVLLAPHPGNILHQGTQGKPHL